MAGFDNDVMYCTGIDTRGTTPIRNQVTLDGQLLIGSTATPHIKVGTLSSSDSTITITNGSGTIDLKANGSAVVLTIDADTGTATPSSGVINLLGSDTITTTASGNTVTISGGLLTWSDTSGTVTALSDHGYFITGACTSTLPASPVQGDVVAYIVDTASVLTIQAAGSQQIRIGNVVSAAGGTCVSTARGDAVTLVYRASDTTWFSQGGPQGNWSIT